MYKSVNRKSEITYVTKGRVRLGWLMIEGRPKNGGPFVFPSKWGSKTRGLGHRGREERRGISVSV